MNMLFGRGKALSVRRGEVCSVAPLGNLQSSAVLCVTNAVFLQPTENAESADADISLILFLYYLLPSQKMFLCYS